MATTIHVIEALPASYPDLGSPSPLSDAAQELDPDMVWQRIEAYTAHRWSERAVEWIVEGPGEWHPPLKPATIDTVEVWSRAGEWEAASLEPSPLGGYVLPCTGPYRFTGTVGDDVLPVPATVLQAFVRLAEYIAAPAGKAGVMSESVTAGSVSISTRHHEAAAARAIQNSGTADLLRPYRRA